MFDGLELDFWLGDWTATWEVGGHGTNHIERDFAGHVIHEQFDAAPDADGTGNLHGESWSVFDPGRSLWRQTWVDDQGSYFDLVGDRVDGWFAFVREAPELGDGGRQRMVFRDVEPDRFRWTWERSLDGPLIWELRWEIAYVRRR